MNRGLTIEEARPIVADVLDKHGIQVRNGGELTRLADGLAIASDPEYFKVTALRRAAAESERRQHRIGLIKELLAGYEAELSGSAGGGPRPAAVHYREKNGQALSGPADFYLRKRHGKELPALLEGLGNLLEVEELLAESSRGRRLDNRRPTKAKNAGAEVIFSGLRELGCDTWPACGIIADMLRDCGIETNTRDKVRRALYDKLRRE